jgi:hypothetical protein
MTTLKTVSLLGHRLTMGRIDGATGAFGCLAWAVVLSGGAR